MWAMKMQELRLPGLTRSCTPPLPQRELGVTARRVHSQHRPQPGTRYPHNSFHAPVMLLLQQEASCEQSYALSFGFSGAILVLCLDRGTGS